MITQEKTKEAILQEELQKKKAMEKKLIARFGKKRIEELAKSMNYHLS